MKSSDTEDIPNLEGSRLPLPNRAYVSLTEAATHIVEDDCRDDDYLIRRERPVAWLNRRRWHSMSGPAWLLPHLKLLRKQQTPKDRKDQKFVAAKQWLDKTGRNPRAAYEQIKAIVERLNAIESAYARLYTLLWNACAAGRIVLSGIAYREDREGNLVWGEREDIPPNFFVDDRIFHYRGGGPRHKGELGPDAYKCFDAILERKGTRRTYAEVRIKREDVDLLARSLGADGQIENVRSGGAPRRKRDMAKAALSSLHIEDLRILGPKGLAKKANELLVERGEKAVIKADTAARARDEIINAK